MKDFYLVADDVVRKYLLAYKLVNGFYYEGCFGPYRIEDDRKILQSQKIVLPTEKELNGWILSRERLPETDGLYSCSADVITYDMDRDSLYQSNWDPHPTLPDWIDAESMGTYIEHKPTHWMHIPSVLETE